MTVTYMPDVYALDAGQSIQIGLWINGDEVNGGEYKGPMVVDGAPIEFGSAVTVSTNRVVFTVEDPSGLSSKCFYWYTFTNEGSNPVSFRIHSFYN